MELSAGPAGRQREIIDVCAAAFTASEGAEEGDRIGDLVRNLLYTTPGEDIFVFCAHEESTIVGCIVFSRLRYDEDDRTVFLLSPVAVRTDRQGIGIGRRLLTYGLEELRRRGADVAITYGDPGYYGRVGFQQLTVEFAQPPLTLTQPHGWLGQSLTGEALTPIRGASRCVEALNDPALW